MGFGSLNILKHQVRSFPSNFLNKKKVNRPICKGSNVIKMKKVLEDIYLLFFLILKIGKLVLSQSEEWKDIKVPGIYIFKLYPSLENFFINVYFLSFLAD